MRWTPMFDQIESKWTKGADGYDELIQKQLKNKKGTGLLVR